MPALSLPALASVTIATAHDTKAQYLSLWYHPACGHEPMAYEGRDIVCEGCQYRYACSGNEPLGLALHQSQFLPKKGFPTWFV